MAGRLFGFAVRLSSVAASRVSIKEGGKWC
jgi:hypothetical protein